MNTTKTGMRTVLAATAAGALIIGSAAGAMADDVTAPVAPAPAVVKIQKVDIHRHSPINVMKARDLKVRLTVRTPLVAAPGVTPTITDATVTLSQFAKKSSADVKANATVDPINIEDWVITHNSDSSVWYLKGSVPAATLAALSADPDAEGPKTAPLPAGKSALLCISSATTLAPATTWSKQTMKRLNMDANKKPVRECVKVYNPKVKPAKKNS